MAKDVFDRMFDSGRTAAEIVATEGLTQIDDESAIRPLVDQVLATHADAVAQYRAGKTTAFGFLVGQVMKAAVGKANPKRVNELLRKMLEAREAYKTLTRVLSRPYTGIVSAENLPRGTACHAS